MAGYWTFGRSCWWIEATCVSLLSPRFFAFRTFKMLCQQGSIFKSLCPYRLNFRNKLSNHDYLNQVSFWLMLTELRGFGAIFMYLHSSLGSQCQIAKTAACQESLIRWRIFLGLMARRKGNKLDGLWEWENSEEERRYLLMATTPIWEGGGANFSSSIHWETGFDGPDIQKRVV
jgi:hypothetical protein